MNTKKMTISAIMAAVGYILHQITPGIPFLGGMKMDFLLLMMFFSVFMLDNLKEVLAVSAVFAIISAITSTFPGGQVANLVDKVTTGVLAYYLYNLIGDRLNSTVKVILIAIVGTLYSGAIFLVIGLSMSGLQVPFSELYMAIVLPTAAMNAVGAIFIEKIMDRAGVLKQLKSVKQVSRA
ncbi:MAG: tryptophan transporter [Clostridiaceae bacterium]